MDRYWVVLAHAEYDRQRTVIVEARDSQWAICLAERQHPGWEAVGAGLQREDDSR